MMTVFDVLKTQFPDSSNTTIRSWIKEGRVTLKGKKVMRADESVSSPDDVNLEKRTPVAKGVLPILYQDDDFVVIDKPSTLLSVATAFDKEETAHHLLKRYFHPRKVHVVHRLDQDTSGVMLFALSEEGYRGLKELFASHTLTREYVAVVQGIMQKNEGTWQCYLYEDKNYKVHITQDKTLGELAITHFVVEKRGRKVTKIRLKLETGKKNQIRVQCQAAGHPIVGDKKYGAKSNPIKRLALHASRLSFIHPITGKEMAFVSEEPESFKQLVDPLS